MAIKTNKSYKKRIKVTKTGKLLVRKPGQNHNNAKETGQKKRGKKNIQAVQMLPKARSLFLSNTKIR